MTPTADRNRIAAAALSTTVVGLALLAWLLPDGGADQQRFVMGTRTYPMPQRSQPARGEVVRDPVFDTAVVRITDKAADGYPDKGIENEYARSDPENSDGSRLVLRGTEASWNLYDARKFKRLRQLDELGRGGQEAEPRWDARNPSLLYHLSGLELVTLDVGSGRQRTVHDFKREFPRLAYVTSGSEGDASRDRRYWCLMVQNDDFKTKSVIVYDRRSDRIVGRRNRLGGAVNYVSMDMSGRHCVVGYDDGDARLFERRLRKSKRLPDNAVGHADLARTAAGRDVLVYQDAKTDWITMADLATGRQTKLVHIPFETNLDIGLHVSGNSAAASGWVLVSTYGARDPMPQSTHSWMDRQLFMLELRPDPRIWRVASTDTITSVEPDGEKHYFAEAFAALNRRATRVYWGSNRGHGDLDRIELYAAILPDGWYRNLPGR